MKSKHKLSGYAIKVGDMVIGWHDGNCEYRHKPWEIGQISTIGDTVHARPKDCASCATYLSRVRRATITDFLRTLPADIAERALRQVDEEWRRYNDHPESLTEAVERFCDWEGTDEKWDFWNHVYEGNYDRARAILAEKDRVGNTPAPEKAEPQPSEFPRVMWVWDFNPKNAYPFTVIRHDSGAIRPWRSELESFKYASDTHPVTGEPAVKKDVVEMIREVVECELTPEIDMVRQIKEILKNDK